MSEKVFFISWGVLQSKASRTWSF